MARAVRPAAAKAKRKKIRIYRGEQRGDIHISGGVAKIRLTPKVILLLLLMVCAAVAVVIVAVRQGSNRILPGAPISRIQESSPASVPSPTHAAESGGPAIFSVELSPQVVTVSTPIELKYTLPDSNPAESATTIRWYVNNSTVQEGPSATLQPGMFQKGAQVYAELTVADGSGKSATLTTSPLTVVNTPPQLSAVTLAPAQPARGGDLTAAAIAADADNDPLDCRYQWLVNGVPSGPAGPQNTFSTTSLGMQDAVSVSAVCSDGTESTQQGTSDSVSFGNGNPEITSSAPDSVRDGVYTYQVVARDPDNDKLQYRLGRMPAGMTIDQSGLIQWTVPKGVMYAGRNEIPVKVTVDDGNGGNAAQEFVIVLIDYVNY